MAPTNPIRFSTKYQDETGLLYYGYRYYNASTGRLLSRDRMEEKMDINVYCFVNNQPSGHIDPWGLFTIDNQAGITINEVAEINRMIVAACNKRFDDFVNADCGFRDCLKNLCQNSEIVLSPQTPKHMAGGEMVPTLGRAGDSLKNLVGCGKNVTLYPNNGNSKTPWGGVAIHEWSHCCGWSHHDNGLDDSISGDKI